MSNKIQFLISIIKTGHKWKSKWDIFWSKITIFQIQPFLIEIQKVFILISKEYVHFQVEMIKIWSNFSFSMRNFKNLNFWIFFFEILKNFTRSKICSNHWVQWSTVQLRKYVEREFKMRLMIALIKFSRVKFEIFEIFCKF